MYDDCPETFLNSIPFHVSQKGVLEVILALHEA